MKLQRTTLALLISAIALGGAVYLFETVHQVRKAEQARQAKRIFQFTEEQITGLTIAVQERNLNNRHEDHRFVFERDRSQPETEQWQMKAPEEGTVDAAKVEFLTNLLVQGERKLDFVIDVDERQDYGLDDPFASITIELAGQAEPEIIHLGAANFDNKLIYAQINPDDQPEKEQGVLVVPLELQYAVERDAEEWLAIEADAEAESAADE